MKEINKLLQTIKEEFPSMAIDISESLEILNVSINDTMIAINNKINFAFSQRDFDEVNKYSELAKRTHLYETKIEEIIELLYIEDIPLEDEMDEDTEKRVIPNYSQYVVDTKVEHTLNEDFTHIRPYAFKLNGQELHEAKNWQEMLIKTCELLINIDSDQFVAFQNNKVMNGKKNKYFSMDPNDMRKPVMISNRIFIEKNMSANAIRTLIQKMLKSFGFKISDYKVYFRADYTSLNKR